MEYQFHRPFSWISSRIGIYDPVEESNSSPSSSMTVANVDRGSLTTEVNPDIAQISRLALGDMRIIGEARQEWAPLRRKYNLYVHGQSQDSGATSASPQYTPANQPLSNSQQLDLTPYNQEGRLDQFAHVDEPFLSWDFSLKSKEGSLIGSVNRNFAGFGREIFTDTGVYALRMDSVGLAQEPEHLVSQTSQQSVGFQNPNDSGMTLDQRAVMLATAVSVDFDYFSRKSGAGGTSLWPLWFPGMGGGEAEAGAGAGAGAGGDDASPQVDQQDANQPRYSQDQQQPPGQVGQNEDVWGSNDDPWGGGGGENGGTGGDGGGGGGGGLDDFDFF